jgi:hypothetical protein
MKSLTICEGVTNIGNEAFSSCYGLTSVTIPNSITSIGYQVFSGCSELTEVTIPNSVTLIGIGAFFRCSKLTSVTIPNSVTNIDYDAFSGCSNLKYISCYAEKVPTATDSSFPSATNATLYVPQTSVDAYKTTAPWSSFGNINDIETKLPQCEMPTINFVDGKLQFACETEDVKYVYSVTSPSSVASGDIDENLPKTYIVSVYATKDGYKDSEVATKEINVSGMGGIRGDVNNDGQVNMPDAMFIVNKVLEGKFPDE